MGIGGDAIFDNGLSDLGDCRHKTKLEKGKISAVGDGASVSAHISTEDDDLELLEFEVMDSENEEDDEDDPFKLTHRKRAATSIVIPEKSSRTDVKRTKTDPGKKTKKKTHRKNRDLLSVLLPDNIDNSRLSNELSILQESTQMTSMISIDVEPKEMSTQSKPNIVKNVLENEENNNEGDETSESSQDIILEKIEVYDVKGNKGWYEKKIESPKDFKNTLAEEDDSNEELQDRMIAPKEGKDVKKKTALQKEPSVPSEPAFELSCEESASGDTIERKPMNNNAKSQNVPLKEIKTTELDSKNRSPIPPEDLTPAVKSTKRKSTLAEICARKSPAPYRVGLSRRANVNHLHSYLSKKG